MLLALLLASCVQNLPLPDLGPCADYPDGVYEYGEIGIGTCLAGPTELRFVDGDDGEPVLLVTNANPYQIFTGGSLLSIPWGAVDPSLGRNLVTDLGAVAHGLPDFAAGLDLQGDLALVTSRLSEGSRVRQSFDDVHLIDLSDPLAPVASTRGTGGGSTITAQSDPVDVVVDPASGYAFVANRTSHSITVLDTSGETIKVVQPWPEWSLTSATFDDADGSGSSGEVAELRITNRDNLPDELWTLSWVEGSWRLWLPEAGAGFDTEGLRRFDHFGGAAYTPNALGTELDPESTGGVVAEVRDPMVLADLARVFFVSEGAIRGAISAAFLGDWSFETGVLFDPADDRWDADPGGPTALADADGQLWIFYDGGGTDSASSPGIGAIVTPDGGAFSDAADAPLINAADAYDSVAIADPTIVYDPETDLFRMVFSAWDGARWTLGQAHSIDLLSWEVAAQPALALDGIDAAAPVLSYDTGSWRVWYARRDAGEWVVAEATSSDGSRWTDQGPVADLSDWAWPQDDPPGIALDAAPNPVFRVSGESFGNIGATITPGLSFVASSFGWRTLLLTGFELGHGDAGSASAGGIRVDSADPDAGLAWLTLTSAGGVRRIGAATLEPDGSLAPVEGPLEGAWLEGTSGFDRDGVSSPVVVPDGDGGWVMYYAGTRGGTTAIGLATSSDGLTWTREGETLSAGPTGAWDAVAASPGSVEVRSDGSIRLWYSGFDGEVWRIGAATAPAPGATLTREPGDPRDYQLSTGAPGEWDDSGVRHPWVRNTEAGLELWYAGFDGSTWRIGHALRPTGEAGFVRDIDENEETRPILEPAYGTFEPGGVRRPVVIPDGDGWVGWYSGLQDDEPRVGGFYGFAPDRLNRTARKPTLGDQATFRTDRGDPDADAIPLDVSLPEAEILGTGLHALSLDSERGLLYAVSKLAPFIVAVDIRDDSTDTFLDQNYLDVEAVMLFTTAAGADGFRSVVAVPGTDRLYGLNDSPEAVWLADLSELTDDAFADVIFASPVGWLPAPRGRERDAGSETQMSIGPAQMALHPDGRRLFVTNFNANSISVYDLSLGPYGQEIAEITLVGENPYAIALAPDGTKAVFANYAGEVYTSGKVEATLGVLDIDPDSPTYLDVVTWVVNQ